MIFYCFDFDNFVLICTMIAKVAIFICNEKTID